jgi:hypothetical protein
MKYIKMLGIAALAALAVMAVVGTGTAAANTKVCKNAAGTECYAAGTKISATSTHAVLTTNLTNVTCTSSTVGGLLTNTSGHGEITSFTFSGCIATSNGSACTVKTLNLPYTATATSEGGKDVLTVSPKAGGGNPGAQVSCPGAFIECTFTTPHIVLDVSDSTQPAQIHAVKEPLNRSGGFCPSESFWDATYNVTQPNPLYIV